MRTSCQPSILKASPSRFERTEESSLYRQPMTDRQWQENLTAVRARMVLLDQSPLIEVSTSLHSAYTWLEQLMERYCAMTCPACQDACCQATKVFYNLADLIVILALGLDPPPGQTRRRSSDPCRYLSPAGCSMKRITRPYVCVWYLCEAQMDLYGEEPAAIQRRLSGTLELIRTLRLKLEAHYESRLPPHLR